MRVVSRRLVSLVLAASAGLGIAPRVAAAQPGRAADSAAAVQAVRGAVALRAPGAPWTISDTADLPRPDGTPVGGVAAREQLQQLLEAGALAVEARVEAVDVFADRVVVRGRFVGTVAGPAGATARVDDAFFAVVTRESDGAWRLSVLSWQPARDVVRAEGLPPMLRARATGTSRATLRERAVQDSTRRVLADEKRRVDSARRAAGCSGDPDPAAHFVTDTVFATIGPLVRGPHFDPARASYVLRDVMGNWTPPRPFLPPVAIASVDPVSGAVAARRALWADLVLVVGEGGHLRKSGILTTSAWADLDKSLLAAAATSDTNATFPRIAAGDTTEAYVLVLALERGDGVSLPLVVMRNLVTSRVEWALPTGGATVVYPKELRRKGLEGEVLATFVVDAQGDVVPNSMHVVRSTHDDFSKAVAEAMPKMHFRPMRLDGCPAAIMVQGPFSFRLMADPEPPDPSKAWVGPRPD
jgi:TonB family protein